MQQRVPIQKFKAFDLALEAKKKLIIENPTVTYQIRRHKDGFNLIRRYSVNNIAQYEEHYAKKRTGASKRQKQRGLDPTFLQEVRKSTKNSS